MIQHSALNGSVSPLFQFLQNPESEIGIEGGGAEVNAILPRLDAQIIPLRGPQMGTFSSSASGTSEERIVKARG